MHVYSLHRSHWNTNALQIERLLDKAHSCFKWGTLQAKAIYFCFFRTKIVEVYSLTLSHLHPKFHFFPTFKGKKLSNKIII